MTPASRHAPIAARTWSPASAATIAQATFEGADATIVESNGASNGANGTDGPSGRTATKDDLFADLAELDQDSQPAQLTSHACFPGAARIGERIEE